MKTTINTFGAVSYETVEQMLIGLCRQATSKTLAVAISGVAGPSGSESKPVGLVFIGVKISSCGTMKNSQLNFGDIERHKIQQKSVHKALKMSIDILKHLKKFLSLALLSKASIIFNAIFSKLIAASFSFINEVNDTSKEKVTSQKFPFSIKDHLAVKDLKGLVLPVIEIVFNFLLTTTLVSKFSVANLKLINKHAEKYSSSFEAHFIVNINVRTKRNKVCI